MKKEKIYALKQTALMRTLVLQKMAKARDAGSCTASISRMEREFGAIPDGAFQKKVKPIIERIYEFLGSKDKDKAMAMLEKEVLSLLAIFKEEGVE